VQQVQKVIGASKLKLKVTPSLQGGCNKIALHVPTQTVLVGLGKRSNCLFYNPIIIKYDFIKVLKYQNQVKGF
jgi:hypothetical protein